MSLFSINQSTIFLPSTIFFFLDRRYYWIWIIGFQFVYLYNYCLTNYGLWYEQTHSEFQKFYSVMCSSCICINFFMNFRLIIISSITDGKWPTVNVPIFRRLTPPAITANFYCKSNLFCCFFFLFSINTPYSLGQCDKVGVALIDAFHADFPL